MPKRFTAFPMKSKLLVRQSPRRITVDVVRIVRRLLRLGIMSFTTSITKATPDGSCLELPRLARWRADELGGGIASGL